MNELERLSRNYKALFEGDPWLDISIMGTLSAISAEKAARKPDYGGNSIWEIANHVSSWRKVVLDRIHGTPANNPDHNYFIPIEDKSEQAWQQALAELQKSQQMWLDFFSDFPESELERQYLDTDYTVFDLILGIMQHDTYHLGQMTLLAKYEM